MAGWTVVPSPVSSIAERSRDSTGGAGWECAPGRPSSTKGVDRLSWLSPKPLWQSRNDRIARLLGDPTNDSRRAWMEQLGHGETAALTVDRSRPDGATSFLVLGDTGEGDDSQRAVVPVLLDRAAGTDFMFICSDVIYPAGGAEEYGSKFFEPYSGYAEPIYAIPGNHDWYDDCSGFMRWFCGAEEARSKQRPGLSPKQLLRRVLWRRTRSSDLAEVARMAQLRPPSGQPASYFAIDTGPLLLVGIDTGITGELDRDQGEWLKRISSESPKPKILITGKPIYVDGEHRAGAIEGSRETVDGIVKARAHNYIAAIGGDIHNYQRYLVEVEEGRTILYLVSGGGGAFTHATHTIPNLRDTEIADRVDEDGFRCYPLRGDSLSRYSKLYARKLLGRLGRVEPLSPRDAEAFMSGKLEMPGTRSGVVGGEIGRSARRSAELLMRLPGKGRGILHFPFSEWLDWDDPPLFKSFLRIDAREEEVRVRCFAATGCELSEKGPPKEDDLLWTAGDRVVSPP